MSPVCLMQQTLLFASAAWPLATESSCAGPTIGHGLQRTGEWRHAPVRTLLDRGRLGRIPLLRSLISFFEMIVLMVSHPPAQRACGAALGCWSSSRPPSPSISGVGFVIPYLIPNALAASVATGLVVFALGIGAMRLGMGKAVWRYHGAEHKAVNAYEGGADLSDLEQVAHFSRVHDRCGSNLAVIALMPHSCQLFRPADLPVVLGGIYSLFVIAVALEFFRLIGRQAHVSRASRVVLAGGRALQRSVTTAEPGPEHLEARDALRRVLDLRLASLMAAEERGSAAEVMGRLRSSACPGRGLGI